MRTAVATLAVFVACGGEKDKKHEPAGSAATAVTPTAPETEKPPTPVAPTPAGPPVDVTGRQLYKDYAKNKVGADAKYRNKLVRMIGVVDHVTKYSDNEAAVYFDGPAETVGIRAHFSDVKGVGSLQRYEAARIRCRGDGTFGDQVMLENCVIEGGKGQTARRGDGKAAVR